MNITSFRLKTNRPKESLKFYTEILGMTLSNVDESKHANIYTLIFLNNHYAIELIHFKETLASQYSQDLKDNYWKYSLFVDDIQRVYNSLVTFKHPIKEPYQFGQIGYLSHTSDTENYQIEFIQKYFKQNTKQTPPKVDYPLAEMPVLGLLTIRTKDPIKIIHFYEKICEMKLMVRMYVERGNGFTLYFLGNNKLTPPSSDIDAIENREWMYQQDHLFIEIQHYWGSEHDKEFKLNTPNDVGLGLNSINFKGNLVGLKSRLNKNSIPFEEIENTNTLSKEIHIKTIDQHKIIVRACLKI